MDFELKRRQQCVIRVDEHETEAVKIAVANLVRDLECTLNLVAQVSQITVGCNEKDCKKEGYAEILVGTFHVSEVFDEFVDFTDLCDETNRLRKEAYLHRISNGKLIIAGSDRRGTIYGIYDLCEALGVSPWHFWADVPVQKKQEFLLPEDYEKVDYPSVEYRGIFINDEEELDAWVKNYMGEATIGLKTYEKVFELLLRLKANYIWPAMHVNSFNLTQENGALADRMGIVVGTSHCDMLMRSNNREWKPWIQNKGYTDAVYDYSIEGRNREILREYWKESVEQNRDFEVCYTLGMRGIHDSGFETRALKGKSEEEIRNAKIALLEKVIADQREILKDTLGHETMMTFIPYKEVLELYDNGLNIPEDMTLVWANDNYGYIRRYPSEKEKRQRGGNGIYYHNSYWSPPSMSYVFLCSIPLAHTRNELQKAWNEGIRKLWVLNSGAMKPLEQEITFFLRLAWEIGKQGVLTEDVEAFVEDWIDKTFTGKIGSQVSVLLNDFSQLTNVRKVENMDCDAFSQTAYGDEAAVRIQRYEELFSQGNMLYERLPKEERDAFFQLVLMRIHAAYFTNLSYYYGDRSTLMYERGNMQAAAYYTGKAREVEDARRRLLHYYNYEMCGGKWNGILNPEGFPPPRTAMMPVCTPPLKIEGEPAMRVDIWNGEAALCFGMPGEKWIEIGNTGSGQFVVRIQAPEWVTLSETQAVIQGEKRILVRVSDVSRDREGELLIESMGDVRRVPIRTVQSEYAKDGCALEEDGLIVLEGDAFENVDSQNENSKSYHPTGKDFKLVRRLGRMQGNLVEACVQSVCDDKYIEVTPIKEIMSKAQPLCYRFATVSKGEFLLEIHRFPSLNSVGRIRIGISLDAGPVQIVESFSNDEWRGGWKKNVLNNVDRLYSKLSVSEVGRHQLCVWAIDKYFAFSRIVIYTSPRKENNLAGIRGAQPLPVERDWPVWCDLFYRKCELLPRPVFYAAPENSSDTIAVTCQLVQAESYGREVTPDWYRERGKQVFAEADGAIRIDAAAVLAQSDCAWIDSHSDKGLWRHCSSESFGRSGLAMYIRTPELSWTPERAPSLNYRIQCEGGRYTLWILAKFNVREEGLFGIGIDREIIPQSRLYGNGRLWRYETEQIYCWVPAVQIQFGRGEHVLHIYAPASGIRYDRLYLTSGGERPPMDSEWM
ncbi:MAG: glycosyl hydrolase 115 family protein [Lachnospiraceae bacterium]|nr:glycosyl hydrolase 115 family protein [Lachnospiraceae bacterium]